MVLSEGTTEKIPSDTTEDRSRDRPASSAAEEIVELEIICNRLSSNPESNAGASECVHRGLPSIPSTKSGFLTSSLQSDYFH
jgi:hypothetical protein